MSLERKSKRQERRAKIAQQERRNRLLTIGLIVIGAALLFLLWFGRSSGPSLKLCP